MLWFLPSLSPSLSRLSVTKNAAFFFKKHDKISNSLFLQLQYISTSLGFCSSQKSYLFDVTDVPNVDAVVVVHHGDLEVLLVVGDGGGVGVARVRRVRRHVTNC